MHAHSSIARFAGILLLCLTVTWPAIATPLPPLSPEATYDLYAAALIDYDMTSAETLAAHLAEDEWSLDDWEKGRSGAEWTFQMSLLDTSILVLDPNFDELVDAAAKSYVAAQKRSSCRARQSSEPVDGVVIVRYSCKIIDQSRLSKALQHAFPKGFNGSNKDDFRRLILAMKVELDSAQATRQVDGAIQLRAASNAGWYIPDWNEVTDVMDR